MTGHLLNCGSGQRPFTKPWLNLDVQSRWEPDLLVDLKQLWPCEDGTAAMVVFHHVWEHEGCGEALAMQREAFRVLQPGRSMLVFVPDLRVLAQRWLLGQIDTQVYMTNLYGAFMGDDHDRHRWGYDVVSLRRELEACPWAEVKPFDWRRIPGADLAKDWWVLAMEAVR